MSGGHGGGDRREVYLDHAAAVREQQQAEESASLSVLERFAAFARDNEGVEPDEELLAAFTALLQDREGDDEL